MYIKIATIVDRTVPEVEHKFITDTIQSLLNCNLDDLPPELLLHNFIWHTKPARYIDCIKEGLSRARVRILTKRLESSKTVFIDETYMCPIKTGKERWVYYDYRYHLMDGNYIVEHFLAVNFLAHSFAYICSLLMHWCFY